MTAADVLREHSASLLGNLLKGPGGRHADSTVGLSTENVRTTT